MEDIRVRQISTLFVGTPPTTSYIFSSAIEIAGLLFVVWTALRWSGRRDAGLRGHAGGEL